MMGEIGRARIKVSGVVQGVGYRYFVRARAVELGLSGYVRNAPDGTVEVVAEGDRTSVKALVSELRVGPRYATVERIDLQWEEPKKDFGGFNYAF